jgi:hypothetical protein
MNNPHLYEVGKLYHTNRTKWPENVEYNYRGGAHELRLFYPSPTDSEIAAVRSGEARFALYPYLDVIFFCFKFGDHPWSDSPYNIHLVGEAERQLPSDVDNAEQRALLTTFMIDANTGILKAMRAVSLSSAFTRTLHAAIWKQHEQPFPPDYDAQIQRVYASYTSSKIANTMAIAKCRGGE